MAKVNGIIWRILAIVVVVLFAAYGVIYGYGHLNGRFEAVETRLEKAEDTRERLIRVEEGVEYLKKTVDEIKKDLKDARKWEKRAEQS